MVYVDADELKWMPYVHKWLSKWESKVKEEVKTYLLDLFERYVELGLRFVSKKCVQTINQVGSLCLYEPCSVKKGLSPLPDDKISDWSKLKQIADDILKCI